MPSAEPSGDPANRQTRSKRPSLEVVKAAVGIIIVLALFIAGTNGKRQAILLGDLEDLVQAGEQLQQLLDAGQPGSQPILNCVRFTQTSPLSGTSAELSASLGALKSQIQRIESAHGSDGLSVTDKLELWLGQAIAANAERRFDEALAAVTPVEESNSTSSDRATLNRRIRILQVRADANYGLQNWPEALDEYKQILAARPGRIEFRARIAECDLHLGRTNEAISAYAALATEHGNRGDNFLSKENAAAALTEYQMAIEIYSCLVDRMGQTNVRLPYAVSLSSAAWLYATSSDKSVRNGRLAREYAQRACELSEWKALVPLQILAAACAETGNFAEAVQWQGKAVQLASGQQQVDARQKLELYKSGKPYRPPSGKAD